MVSGAGLEPATTELKVQSYYQLSYPPNTPSALSAP